jgi:hypothetical protein
MENNINKHKQNFIAAKKDRRVLKRTAKRSITGEEVIFIFEKVLEGWPTIKIFNTLIQTNPLSGVLKKKVEVIATGNCKVFENELEPTRYQDYLALRQKVYALKKPDVINI